MNSIEKLAELFEKFPGVGKRQAKRFVYFLLRKNSGYSSDLSNAILNLKKPLLILDLSIPKNVHENVTEIEGVTLIHMDNLSQMTDDTLERRKQHIPAAEAIIEDIKLEFNTWMNGRKYAPTIHALKAKLNEIKDSELNFQRKKLYSQYLVKTPTSNTAPKAIFQTSCPVSYRECV
jgi:glutamyl-tRNA reductase